MKITLSGSHNKQQGAALIEFAFVLLPLLMLVIGTLLYGLVFVTQQAIAFAAQRGADAIVRVDPDGPGIDSLGDYCSAGLPLAIERVNNVLPAVGLLDIEIPTVQPSDVSSGAQPGCLVTVKTKDFPLQIPLLPLPDTLRGVGFVPIDLS